MKTAINGHSIHYSVQGEGTPIVLVHGFSASHHDWDNLIPVLVAKNFETYAIDLLGHGKSEKPNNPELYNINYIDGIFSEWIQALSLKQKPILLGLSLGGYLILEYASHHPEKGQPIILVNPLFTDKQLPNYHLKAVRLPGFMQLISKHKPTRFLDLIVKTKLFNSSHFTYPKRKQFIDDIRDFSPHIMRILNSSIDLSDQLIKITNPAFLIWGEKDRTLKPKFYSLLLNQLNITQYKIFPNEGHRLHVTNPSDFNECVVSFIQDY